MDFNLALQKQLTDRQRRKDQNSNVERVWSATQIKNAFLETFEMVGGVPRLAVWANDPENYATFLKMLITLAPKGAASLLGDKQGQVIQYVSNVPSSPLNRKPPTDEIAEGVFEDGSGDRNSGGAHSSADLGDEQAVGHQRISGDNDQGVPHLYFEQDDA